MLSNICRYKNLQHQARERKQRLEESKIRFAQSREMNELQHWIYDKVSMVIMRVCASHSGTGHVCQFRRSW